MEITGLEILAPQVSPRARLRYEIIQRRETGHDTREVEGAVADLPADAADDVVWALFDRLADAPRDPAWAYDEPESAEDIRRALPAGAEPAPPRDRDLDDRVHGGWLGRIAGCNLGKPVEDAWQWPRPVLRAYLESVDAYPLRDYIPKADGEIPGYRFRDNWTETTRGRLRGSARDDDIDYSIVGLQILETAGRGYTGVDAAGEWLTRLPILQTFTAEIVAIANIVAGVHPPDSGGWRNPFREWIGALIRADIHGWTNPGDPRAAALQAIPDAMVSHRANGVYGEMWAAALVAAAFTADDIRSAVVESLRHVPPRARLAEAVRDVLASYDEGLAWDDALDRVDAATGHYHPVHSVNNAAAITAGLLWSEGDFSAAIGLTVQAGLDTDSNGATAGSVAGVLVGAAGIPQHRTAPLEDRVASAVMGFDGARISDLAARTARLARS